MITAVYQSITQPLLSDYCYLAQNVRSVTVKLLPETQLDDEKAVTELYSGVTKYQ
jgi:hypothetical protein